MKHSVKTFMFAGLLVLGIAIFSTLTFANDYNDCPKPLLYQMVDSTDGNGSGDSNGGGVKYPGTGH